MTVTQLGRPATPLTEEVIPMLQATLVELIDLSLAAKQAHWNVAGPLFKPVHEQLDLIVDIARLASDEVAERIATLGGDPDGRAPTIAEASLLDQLPAGSITTERAVALVGGLLDSMSTRLHQRISFLADPDPISQGILITAAEQLEKQAWMLRKQIP